MNERIDERTHEGTDDPSPDGDGGQAWAETSSPEPRIEMSSPEPRIDLTGEPGSAGADEFGPLLNEEDVASLSARWDEVQGSFVDEPRTAVAEADRLVEDIIQRLTLSFAGERIRLERRWDHGEDVSTEDMRMAIRRYRSFFQRLLAA
jgi:hypothetical protein